MQPFLKDSQFFFTDFHSGAVNIAFHIAAIIIIIYALTVHSLPLFLLGILVVDELGHIYNYYFVHKNELYHPLRMLPYQALYVTPFIIGLPVYFGLL